MPIESTTITFMRDNNIGVVTSILDHTTINVQHKTDEIPKMQKYDVFSFRNELVTSNYIITDQMDIGNDIHLILENGTFTIKNNTCFVRIINIIALNSRGIQVCDCKILDPNSTYDFNEHSTENWGPCESIWLVTFNNKDIKNCVMHAKSICKKYMGIIVDNGSVGIGNLILLKKERKVEITNNYNHPISILIVNERKFIQVNPNVTLWYTQLSDYL